MNLGGMGMMADRALRPSFLGGGKRKWQFLGMKVDLEQYQQLAALMAEGKVKVPIDEAFAFDKVPEAYTRMKTGRAKGKIVVKVGEDN